MTFKIAFFLQPQPDRVYEILEKAFSSYTTPILLDKETHLKAWATQDLDWGLSVGVYQDEQLIGFILHGKNEGSLKNIITALLPKYQGKGLIKHLYPTLFPVFREKGFGKVSLEVLALNEKAVRCYSKIGFRITHRLEENALVKFEMMKLI